MPKKLHRSLRIYFSKLKKIPTPTTNSLLLACNQHHKSNPSFTADRRHVIINDDDDDVNDCVIKPSDRFFVSPGRRSSSLFDDVRTPSSSEDPEVTVPDDSVAVMTFTWDPYADFRRSMEEMVESRSVEPLRPRLDWEFMEELLLCYLELNDRSVHKYILKAFADFTVSFCRRRIPEELQRVPAATTKGGRRKEKGACVEIAARAQRCLGEREV